MNITVLICASSVLQGVAQTFSTAYHMVDMRRKLLRITESAISWIKRRSPHVAEIMVYLVEPGKNEDFVLRRMMTTDNKGFPIHAKDPPVRLERKDNLFRCGPQGCGGWGKGGGVGCRAGVGRGVKGNWSVAGLVCFEWS